MSDLWIPETSPPHVSEEAQTTIAERILTDSLDQISESGYKRLHARHEPLGDYIVRLGYHLNTLSAEGDWPKQALKVGSAVALVAYEESGYYQHVDDTAFQVGEFSAELEGVPLAYVYSAICDPALGKLVDAIMSLPCYREDIEGGVRQVLTVGAGCTRHFMQHAIAA